MASSAASSTPPHFFKVILSHTLTQQKLEVPMKFVRLYGETLQSEEVCLKVVNGVNWKIELKKVNQEIWLEKGWAEFVKFYSINIGHFIVFTYEGNSCFHVLIFDKTATGIDYPTASREFNNEKKSEEGEIKRVQIIPVKKEIEEFEENGCAQILGKNKRSKKENKNNNVTQNFHKPTPKSMKRSDQAGGSKVICKKVEMKKKEELHTDLKPHQVRNKVPPIATLEARMNTEIKASKFKSQIKNPSFMVTVGSSYLYTGRGYVCIPIDFGYTHMRNTKEFTLQVSDHGNAWKVKCVERWYFHRQRFEMGNGWRKFARDNNLKEGDVCVFELIKNSQISFKTTIFRSAL